MTEIERKLRSQVLLSPQRAAKGPAAPPFRAPSKPTPKGSAKRWRRRRGRSARHRSTVPSCFDKLSMRWIHRPAGSDFTSPNLRLMLSLSKHEASHRPHQPRLSRLKSITHALRRRPVERSLRQAAVVKDGTNWSEFRWHDINCVIHLAPTPPPTPPAPASRSHPSATATGSPACTGARQSPRPASPRPPCRR